MQRKQDGKQKKDSESGDRADKPISRKTSSVSSAGSKSSAASVDIPSFRSAAVQMSAAAMLPPTSQFIQSPYGYGYSEPKVATADVAPIQERATRPAATLSMKPFAISKESVGSFPSIRKPIETSKEVPIWRLTYSSTSTKPGEPSRWVSPTIPRMLKHYPLERTNRPISLEQCSIDELFSRLLEGFRIMSVQVKCFDRPASAALLTPENVEIHLSFWESIDNSKVVIVEVQRCRGDSVIFHKYASHILDAASGNLDVSLFSNDEGSIAYLQSAENLIRAELSRIAPDNDIDKEARMALELVYGLLTKDRRDARKLGMEGVCVLANARKSVLSAAILTSRAILLGGQTQASEGVHTIVLDIIQNRKIGDIGNIKGGGDPDSDDEPRFLDDDEKMQGYSHDDKEEITLLFSLALDALAYALEVITTFGVDPAASFEVSAAWVVDNYFKQTQMLGTLLEVLQRASVKPHNAWLAAKSLRFACSASPYAASQFKLEGMDHLESAYNIGVSSHAKLESECLKLSAALAH